MNKKKVHKLFSSVHDTLSAGVRLDYKIWTVWPKIAEDGSSLQDKTSNGHQRAGAGPMVPEEEEEEDTIHDIIDSNTSKKQLKVVLFDHAHWWLLLVNTCHYNQV